MSDGTGAEVKTKKITVCVTGEYNEKTREISGGDKVEIKVDGGTPHISVEDALKELTKKSVILKCQNPSEMVLWFL